MLYFEGRKFWIWGTLSHAMNIFTKWQFHNAWNGGFFVKNIFQFHALVQKCHFENCQFGKIEPLHGTFDPMQQFWFFLEVNAFIWSTMKVQFNENIYDMYQCPPNPGFTSIKVQNVDFLKKPSVDNIFFSSIMFF